MKGSCSHLMWFKPFIETVSIKFLPKITSFLRLYYAEVVEIEVETFTFRET